MTPNAADDLGAPPWWEDPATPTGAAGRVEIVLTRKPANRMPESGVRHVLPLGRQRMGNHKMGSGTPPTVSGRAAAARLQAISAGARPSPATRPGDVPLDTALVGPERATSCDSPGPAAFGPGMRFVLYNNKWGTNFPMWW